MQLRLTESEIRLKRGRVGMLAKVQERIMGETCNDPAGWVGIVLQRLPLKAANRRIKQ